MGEYAIRVKGHLQGNWRDWFGPMTIEDLPHGEMLLCGPVADQATLYGYLHCIRDLGMELIAVNPLKTQSTENAIHSGY